MTESNNSDKSPIPLMKLFQLRTSICKILFSAIFCILHMLTTKLKFLKNKDETAVIQRVDTKVTTHRIIHYPLGNSIDFAG